MDIVFLDANVLFSAAYRLDAKFLDLWRMSDVRLVSSHYAAGEAQRNLRKQEQLDRLEMLLSSVDLSPVLAYEPLPQGVHLPAKDAPVLLAAIAVGATHLLSTDLKHFGLYYDRVIEGVLIVSPAGYFLTRPL